MTLPPLTDLFALLGINLVLCAAVARLLSRYAVAWPRIKWIVAAFFVLLWLPVGVVHMPVVAYIRGVSSDLSVTLVLLACVGLYQRLGGVTWMSLRDRTAALAVVATAAVLLYPTALGWGNFDAYRLGWGSPALLGGLLMLCIASWMLKFRLLPFLIAAALLAWVGGVMESTNLWDYLMDPWLVVLAFAHGVRIGVAKLFELRKPPRSSPAARHG